MLNTGFSTNANLKCTIRDDGTWSLRTPYEQTELTKTAILNCFRDSQRTSSIKILSDIYIDDQQFQRIQQSLQKTNNKQTFVIFGKLLVEHFNEPPEDEDEDVMLSKRRYQPCFGENYSIGKLSDDLKNRIDTSTPSRINSFQTLDVVLKISGAPFMKNTEAFSEALIGDYVIPLITPHTPHLTEPLFVVYNLDSAMINEISPVENPQNIFDKLKAGEYYLDPRRSSRPGVKQPSKIKLTLESLFDYFMKIYNNTEMKTLMISITSNTIQSSKVKDQTKNDFLRLYPPLQRNFETDDSTPLSFGIYLFIQNPALVLFPDSTFQNGRKLEVEYNLWGNKDIDLVDAHIQLIRKTFFQLMFQVLYSLECLNRFLVRHNDLHTGNVMCNQEAGKYPEAHYPIIKYHLSSGKTIVFDQIRIFPMIIDYDRSWAFGLNVTNTDLVVSNLRPFSNNGHLCDGFGQCAKPNDLYDTTVFLLSVYYMFELEFRSGQYSLPFASAGNSQQHQKPYRQVMKDLFREFQHEILIPFLGEDFERKISKIKEIRRSKNQNHSDQNWNYAIDENNEEWAQLREDRVLLKTNQLLELKIFEQFSEKDESVRKRLAFSSKQRSVVDYSLPKQISGQSLNAVENLMKSAKQQQLQKDSENYVKNVLQTNKAPLHPTLAIIRSKNDEPVGKFRSVLGKQVADPHQAVVTTSEAQSKAFEYIRSKQQKK